MEFKYHFNKSCSMSIARNCGNEYYININRGKNALSVIFLHWPESIDEDYGRTSSNVGRVGWSTRPVRWEDQNERHFVFTVYNGEVDKKENADFLLGFPVQ